MFFNISKSYPYFIRKTCITWRAEKILLLLFSPVSSFIAGLIHFHILNVSSYYIRKSTYSPVILGIIFYQSLIYTPYVFIWFSINDFFRKLPADHPGKCGNLFFIGLALFPPNMYPIPLAAGLFHLLVRTGYLHIWPRPGPFYPYELGNNRNEWNMNTGKVSFDPTLRQIKTNIIFAVRKSSLTLQSRGTNDAFGWIN